MKKLVVCADSQVLSCYNRCTMEYKLAYEEHLRLNLPQAFTLNGELIQLQKKKPLDMGSLIHTMMALYYRLRRRGFDATKSLKMVTERRFKRFSDEYEMTNAQKLLVLTRFFEYVSFRQNESLKPIGIETGFSEKIYEDKNFIFIYEGRIDLIGTEYIEKVGDRLEFVDHKTRGTTYDLDVHVNQFLGYAWALRQIFGNSYNFSGMINYIGFQESIKDPEKLFQREYFSFSEKQIKHWQEETIWWFHRIAQSKLFNIYHESLNCTRKFGMCQFKKLCKEPEKPIKIQMKKSYYVETAEKWTAWD